MSDDGVISFPEIGGPDGPVTEDVLRVFGSMGQRDELPLLEQQRFVVHMLSAEVGKQVDGVMSVADICRHVVERVSATGGRILRADGYDEDCIQVGLHDGSLRYLTQGDLLKLMDRTKAGISVTGGGDSAGIADCLAALAENLDGGRMLLGVKNAASGLVVPCANFDDGLIIVDNLLIEDLRGQASTPFGSARMHAMNGDRDNTLRNIDKFGFLSGTGGNGQLGLFIEVSKEFPDRVVVSTPKTIDGDVCINGEPVQALGFDTALKDYQRSIFNIAQSVFSHREVTVVEVFGRSSGRLAFEAARHDPRNFCELKGNPDEKDLVRKIEEFGVTVMILVPEKPTSLKDIADEVAKRKRKFGSCVVVVAEGFVPTGLVDDVNGGGMIKNVGKLVMEAIKDFAGIEKVKRASQSYEARGATPSHYDQIMGAKCGKAMAGLINGGVAGGKVVVYPEGVDPLTQEPLVMDLKEVSDKNTLRNAKLYSDDVLRKGGVFWKN